MFARSLAACSSVFLSGWLPAWLPAQYYASAESAPALADLDEAELACVALVVTVIALAEAKPGLAASGAQWPRAQPLPVRVQPQGELGFDFLRESEPPRF